MYFDNRACEVCGSPIQLRATEPPDEPAPNQPVGPVNGAAGEADATPDNRVCTNRDCPTNREQG